MQLPDEIMSVIDGLKAGHAEVKAEIEAGKEVSKGCNAEIESLRKRIEEGAEVWLTVKSKKIVEFDDEIAKLKAKVQGFDNRFNELVHVDDFDDLNNLVSYIHSKVDGLGGDNNGSPNKDSSDGPKPPAMKMGAKDSNKLRDLTTKFDDMDLI